MILWQIIMAKSVGPFHQNIMADQKLSKTSAGLRHWNYAQWYLVYCVSKVVFDPTVLHTASLIQAKYHRSRQLQGMNKNECGRTW